jgi:hypothetical protein
MADIIPEEIRVKGKRPETFSGGLYGLGGAPGGGGTSGTGIGGLYGLAGPGSYANLARLGAEDEFRMKGVNDATAEGQAAYDAIVAASAAIDTPGEFTKVLNDAYVALRAVEDLQLYRSLVWTAEQDARAKLDTLIRDGAEQKKIDFATDQYNDAVKGSEDFNRMLEDAQATSLAIQQEVSQNVPKDFAKDFAAQNNKSPLAYTDTFVDKAVDAGLAGIGSLAGGLYRGAHAVGSNLPVVGGYVGDAIEGAGEWFQTSPGVIAGSPTSVQGQWGPIPPWMPTSQVNVLGQIPGSATNVGTMTGTILDTLNAVRNGQITLSEAIEEGGLTELATVLGVSDLALQAAALAGKTLQDVISEANNVTNSVAQQTQNQQLTTENDSDLDTEGGTTFGGFTTDENLATTIINSGNAAEKAAAAEKLLTDQQAALAKATKVFDDAGGGTAGTAAVLKALEDNGLTVQDLSDQTGIPLTELNTFIGANTTVGADTVVAGGGADTVVAGGGADTVVAGGGADTVVAGGGTDTVVAGGGADTVVAGGGADTVVAGGGTDTVVAGGGTDTVVAGGGTDTVVAGGGTDTVVAGGGTDTVVAGGGTDIVVAGGENELTEVNLNEETTLTSGGTEVPGLSEVLALPETPEQIIGQGGMESVSTEKAGVADITAQYNPALSLAENMAILRGARSKEEDIVDSAIYYGGGMIQNTDMTDEINRLLRGY